MSTGSSLARAPSVPLGLGASNGKAPKRSLPGPWVAPFARARERGRSLQRIPDAVKSGENGDSKPPARDFARRATMGHADAARPTFRKVGYARTALLSPQRRVGNAVAQLFAMVVRSTPRLTKSEIPTLLLRDHRDSRKLGDAGIFRVDKGEPHVGQMVDQLGTGLDDCGVETSIIARSTGS